MLLSPPLHSPYAYTFATLFAPRYHLPLLDVAAEAADAVYRRRIADALGWTFLAPLPISFGYLAIGAWSVTFRGLLVWLVRWRRGAQRTAT